MIAIVRGVGEFSFVSLTHITHFECQHTPQTPTPGTLESFKAKDVELAQNYSGNEESLIVDVVLAKELN